jgi:hypothetical protein
MTSHGTWLRGGRSEAQEDSDDPSKLSGKGAGRGGDAGRRLAVSTAMGKKVNVAATERGWIRDKPQSMCPLRSERGVFRRDDSN